MNFADATKLYFMSLPKVIQLSFKWTQIRFVGLSQEWKMLLNTGKLYKVMYAYQKQPNINKPRYSTSLMVKFKFASETKAFYLQLMNFELGQKRFILKLKLPRLTVQSKCTSNFLSHPRRHICLSLMLLRRFLREHDFP